MTMLQLRNGETLDIESLPKDVDALTKVVLESDVLLDPLDGDEAEVDPACFMDEIRNYLKELLRTKGLPPAPSFVEGGRIGEAVYWVYSSSLDEENPLFVLVVRILPITEVFGAEQSASYLDPATGAVIDRVLTPAQAALLDFCLQDAPPQD